MPRGIPFAEWMQQEREKARSQKAEAVKSKPVKADSPKASKPAKGKRKSVHCFSTPQCISYDRPKKKSMKNKLNKLASINAIPDKTSTSPYKKKKRKPKVIQIE